MDQGVQDKRLLINEPELARILKSASSSGNTLSPVLRVVWDSPRVLTNAGKTAGNEATEAHISGIFHITRCDLDAVLSMQEVGNGLGNRFIWIASKRTQKISRPSRIDWAKEGKIIETLKQRVQTAKEQPREFDFTRAGLVAWDQFYQNIPELSGQIGQMTSRTDAHTMRLAMIYAALDGVTGVEPCHIDAAAPVTEYATRTVQWLFATTLGSKNENKLAQALRRSPEGLSRDQIYSDVFNRNVSKTEIEILLTGMLESGSAAYIGQKNSKNPEVWFAKEHESTVKPISTLQKVNA